MYCCNEANSGLHEEAGRPKTAAGTCAVIGGATWVAACFVLAALPTGWVGQECLTQPQRNWSTSATILVLVGFALMAASGLGMLTLAFAPPVGGPGGWLERRFGPA